MAGTREGGIAAAKANKSRYGDDYYARIGAKGGRKGTTGGFHYSKAHGLNTHVDAGRKGGTLSRKRKQRGSA